MLTNTRVQRAVVVYLDIIKPMQELANNVKKDIQALMIYVILVLVVHTLMRNMTAL